MLNTLSKTLRTTKLKKLSNKKYRNKLYKRAYIIVALFFMGLGIYNVSQRGLEKTLDKQQQLIETQSERIEMGDKIELELEAEVKEEQQLNKKAKQQLEKAKTDVERLQEEQEDKDAEIKKLEKELQAKLERQRLAKLASSTSSNSSTNNHTSAVVTSTPVVNRVANPQPVVQPVNNWNNNFPWGQCTWYVAGKAGVANGSGNAKDWAWSLPNQGFRQTGPVAGAVAVMQPGVHGAHSYYGHVSYVESVNANGTVNISEYNWNCPLCLHYRTVSASGIQFFVR